MIRRLGSSESSWLLARVLVAVGFFTAVFAASRLLDHPTLQLRQGLVAWDGAWYADIARHGYAALPREALRFFPLFPLLGRAVSWVLFGDTAVALVIVANTAALGLAFVLHRLALFETASLDIADRTVWFLALFPAAAVLALAYGEALAMALAAAAFLALRRRRWLRAAAAGLLLGLTRPVGPVLALPAAIEAARDWRAAPKQELAARFAAIAAPIAGAVAYLVWVGVRFDDFLLPLRVHERPDLRGHFVFPLWRAAQSFAHLVTDPLGDGLHAPFIALVAVLLVVLFRRWPASYGWYTTALVLVALSAQSLGSFERYAMAAFPLFLAAAELIRDRRLSRAVLVIEAAALLSFTALVFLDVFVP